MRGDPVAPSQNIPPFRNIFFANGHSAWFFFLHLFEAMGSQNMNVSRTDYAFWFVFDDVELTSFDTLSSFAFNVLLPAAPMLHLSLAYRVVEIQNSSSHSSTCFRITSPYVYRRNCCCTVDGWINQNRVVHFFLGGWFTDSKGRKNQTPTATTIRNHTFETLAIKGCLQIMAAGVEQLVHLFCHLRHWLFFLCNLSAMGSS